MTAGNPPGLQRYEGIPRMRRKHGSESIPRQGQPRAKAIEGAQLALRKVLIIGKE